MALSEQFIEQHIARWEQALTSPFRPYRSKWPSRLFHHAPVENAAGILISGNLRSRDDVLNERQRDVAAAGVIDNRTHSHPYTRFYFRPRTPTQYHIEGIKKIQDCAYGPDVHAPVLVMFVFDARRILASAGVKFCDRNTQLATSTLRDSEEHFLAIPFDKVFHEGGIGGDRSIIEHRCAEVLATSPVVLAQTLQWVYCRTQAEKLTLLHMLGEHAATWQNKILVSDDLQVFDKRFVFVEDVTLRNNGVVFHLSPRQDLTKVEVAIKVSNPEGTPAITWRTGALAATPPPPSKGWIIKAELPNGRYLVEIHLEGHLAYQSYHNLGQDIFL